MIRILLLCILTSTVKAQVAVVSSGGNFSNSQGQLQTSIGEVAINTFSNTNINLLLTQGYLQPNNNNVVPIRIIDFKGSITSSNSTMIHWKVQEDQSADYYTLQYSTDGVNFKEIATIKALGNNKLINDYSYAHSQAGATNYYRLIATEKTGQKYSSWIINLNIINKESTKIYPNPVSTSFTLDIMSTQNSIIDYQIYDMSGKIILQKKFSLNIGRNVTNIDVSTLPAGTYLLKTSDNNSFKIIKQ